MNVYAESNFVLEHALQQEGSDSCGEIIRLASAGKITLVVPAFSLAEPYQAISGKEKARLRLVEDLRGHLRELARSKPHREILTTFKEFADVLIGSAQLERDGLRETVSELLASVEIMPLDATVLRSGVDMEARFRLSGQDAIVLASVLQHLEATQPNESCFLNRNSKDFDEPEILTKLEEMHCKFFSNFTKAHAYVVSRLGSAG